MRLGLTGCSSRPRAAGFGRFRAGFFDARLTWADGVQAEVRATRGPFC